MGRGSSRGGGTALGKGRNKNVRVISSTDVWSYRHRRDNEAFVDQINSSVRTMEDDFPGLMQTVTSVNAAELGGKDKTQTLGFYSPADKSVSMNQYYTDIDRMNAAYDNSGSYHPGRGNKTAVEAVSYHEMGHALTDHVGAKLGATGIDDAAKRIVDNAYNNSGGKGGTKAWANKISGYAAESNAECIAEAVCDWYCNGSKANAASKAIMTELKRYA